MRSRYKIPTTLLFPIERLHLFSALRKRWREGYGFADLRADLMSGVIVGMVAIPLGMALAVASGVPPQYGLYTVILGGGLVALLGGSRFQVTGPTAAFVVILAPIAHNFGIGGLLTAGLMAGLMLMLMGVARMGRLIQFIPHPVTTGFTSGIATVIAVLQLKDFFGLEVPEMPERFLEKVVALGRAAGTVSLPEMGIGIFTLLLLIYWPKLNKKIPAPLVALSAATLGAVFLEKLIPGLELATIRNRFSFDLGGVTGQGIPQMLPAFGMPWNFGALPFTPTLETFESLVSSAFAIAMLGAIESLLSAVVADGMAQTKHDPDSELLALGIGNVVCPFFGGIPATGAIARTATNIRFGARSPISAVIHALFTLFVLLLFAPYVSYLPMAALAALLLIVAYNMSELRHFAHILRVAPKSDVIVLLIVFALTVLFDMVVGVSVGIVLAALLFMRRMAEVTDAHRVLVSASGDYRGRVVPRDIVLYEIAGPMFFGAAEKAAETISGITDNVKGFIFLMDGVYSMDMTGLVAMESAIRKLARGGRKICLVGLRPQPKELVRRSGLIQAQVGVSLCDNLDQALEQWASS